MKAIAVYEAGPPESLAVAELPEPMPGPNEILIQVRYSGVNHGDVLRRKRGIFPPNTNPPHILGFEGAGTIKALGKRVTQFKQGQRVGFLVESGAYAQVVSIPESHAFLIPDGLPDSIVAGSVCVGTTAWHLVRLASLARGQAVLIHGGTGGAGSALVQMCKKYNVSVLTTVGSNAKAKYAREIGANEVINYREENVVERVMQATNDRGVDVVFDCVGAAVVGMSLACLRKGGLLLYFGSSSGHPQFPGDKILSNELRINGFVIFSTFQHPHVWQAGVDGLVGALKDGTLRTDPTILPMEKAAQAHKMLEEHSIIGKIVLDMS